MAELGIVEYFGVAEALGIIATLFVFCNSLEIKSKVCQ
jgi:hypothetical protein